MYFKQFLLILAIMIVGCLPSMAQEETKTSTEELKGKLDGIDENVTTLMTDVEGLKKLKISGYFQAQYEKSELMKGIATSPYDNTDFAQSRFRIRRGRVKITYDAGLTQFVFQGDFSNNTSTANTGNNSYGFALKDFYLNITDPWTKMVDFTIGQFNRPVYEVEYSSSQREAPERSATCLKLYPNERDLGAMFSIHPEDWFKLQLAVFNNSFLSSVGEPNPAFRDDNVYYMARLTKQIPLMEGLDLDLGVHTRMGQIRSNSRMILASDVPMTARTVAKGVDSASTNYGLNVSKNWFGFEMQLYWDFLGGMKLLGEYWTGSTVDQLALGAGLIANKTNGKVDSLAPSTTPVRKRDFAGFYVMLVKNLGTEWQLAARLDQYNPNTKIDIAKVDNAADLAITTIGFGIHNYTFQNIRITLWYDMPKTKLQPSNIVGGKETSVMLVDPKDNLLTLRFQYKF